MADIIKSEQKGKMITCCRDNNFVFLKYIGKGDADGGYNEIGYENVLQILPCFVAVENIFTRLFTKIPTTQPRKAVRSDGCN